MSNYELHDDYHDSRQGDDLYEDREHDDRYLDDQDHDGRDHDDRDGTDRSDSDGVSEHQSFDAADYLAANHDVFETFGWDLSAAESHYRNHGIHEGRSVEFDEAAYLKLNPDVANAGISAELHYAENGFAEGRETEIRDDQTINTNFDAADYLALNHDLFQAFGWDFAAAEQHYNHHGASEGRRTDFDEDAYLSSNPDLASTEVSPEYHYAAHGFTEGRSIGVVGSSTVPVDDFF